ncbi:helix-turn-helix domain-containing protein [Aerococcus christensenii]|uniref:helix-turn-helix domain-containing protein n=1 Tax=Aerococcus christensenii TaxID=87541 RepID=UPI00254ABCCA|nr:helix-turn-helix transcriptional regulator [Aerococcus christensenii]MDK8234512.1 helix-turn-helix transcriptional regulator [Aerococcus christensenii]
MLLKYYRLKHNLSLTEIAYLIGTNYRSYQRYEKGEVCPNYQIIKRLEDYFRIPSRILFSKTPQDVPEWLKTFIENECFENEVAFKKK